MKSLLLPILLTVALLPACSPPDPEDHTYLRDYVKEPLDKAREAEAAVLEAQRQREEQIRQSTAQQ